MQSLMGTLKPLHAIIKVKTKIWWKIIVTVLPLTEDEQVYTDIKPNPIKRVYIMHRPLLEQNWWLYQM